MFLLWVSLFSLASLPEKPFYWLQFLQLLFLFSSNQKKKKKKQRKTKAVSDASYLNENCSVFTFNYEMVVEENCRGLAHLPVFLKQIDLSLPT